LVADVIGEHVLVGSAAGQHSALNALAVHHHADDTRPIVGIEALLHVGEQKNRDELVEIMLDQLDLKLRVHGRGLGVREEAERAADFRRYDAVGDL